MDFYFILMDYVCFGIKVFIKYFLYRGVDILYMNYVIKIC